jgi:hypothetical protein
MFEVCMLMNWLNYISRSKEDNNETEGKGIKKEEQPGPMGKKGK